MAKKRYTLGTACGEWLVWDHRGEARLIATCRSEADGRKILRLLNAKQ